MGEVAIWKYENKNYFEGSVKICIDKIQFMWLPQNSFPLFDESTEEILGIAQYNPGEFDVKLFIDGGESSAILSKPIYNFFFDHPRDNKFLIGIKINSRKYWGTFTNADIEFGFGSREINIRVRHIQNELKEQFEKSLVGLLGSSVRFENYIVNNLKPENVYRFTSQTVFSSYASLIGDPDIYMNHLIQNSGAWVSGITSWQGFIELMTGTGLNFEVINSLEPVPLISANTITFTLNVFSLNNITPQTSEPKFIGNPVERTLFNPLKWLFIPYRKFNPPEGYESEPNVYDGILSNGINTYNTDTLRGPYAVPTITWGHYCFIQHDTYMPIERYTPVINGSALTDYAVFKDSDLKIIELPLYNYTKRFEPIPEPPPVIIPDRTIAYSRCVCNNQWHNYKVQEFAMSQYKRYLGSGKRIIESTILYNHDYKLWQGVPITLNGDLSHYFVSRIQNINNINRTADVTFIKL